MRIYLRPVSKQDSQMIVKWRNTPKVLSHYLSKKQITVESNEQFYDQYIETKKYLQFIVERIDDEYGVVSYPIATVYLKDIDYKNRRCELCIFTSDDEEWYSESQTMAIRLLLDKVFKEMNFHKVYTYVFANNKDEIALFEAVGFNQDAYFPEEAFDLDGSILDLVRLSLFNK